MSPRAHRGAEAEKAEAAEREREKREEEDGERREKGKAGNGRQCQSGAGERRLSPAEHHRHGSASDNATVVPTHRHSHGMVAYSRHRRERRGETACLRLPATCSVTINLGFRHRHGTWHAHIHYPSTLCHTGAAQPPSPSRGGRKSSRPGRCTLDGPGPQSVRNSAPKPKFGAKGLNVHSAVIAPLCALWRSFPSLLTRVGTEGHLLLHIYSVSCSGGSETEERTDKETNGGRCGQRQDLAPMLAPSFLARRALCRYPHNFSLIVGESGRW